LKKYGAVAIFFLYGNKNVPSAKILRGRRCQNQNFYFIWANIYLWCSSVLMYSYVPNK
jgi:hypothetical protein